MTSGDPPEIVAARLAAIVESTDDAIVSKDLSGIVMTWNAGAEATFGYSAAEMVGSPIHRLIPEERLGEEEVILAKIRRGLGVPRFVTVRRRKDGGLITVSVTISPVRGPDGSVIGASKIARDITEELRRQKALAASEVWHRRLFESAKDGILLLDGETGAVVDVNPSLAELLGRSRKDFLERKVFELGFLGDVLARQGNFDELRVKEYVRHESLRVQNASGQSIDVEFSSHVYLVDGLKVVQCNFRDITARKKAEHALRELHAQLERRVADRTADLETANRELEAFSYSVSHDLRAPLRSMDAFSQAVLEDYGPNLPEEGQRYLNLIRSGAQKMGELIDDLLAFSRLGRAPLNKQRVHTQALIQTVLDDLGPAREGRNIDLRIGDLPPCAGDPALLRQVWVNLVSNAIKYTRGREPALVEIGFAPGSPDGIFFVRDNGTGFDMKYVSKLFGVFQRLHRAEDFEGTGVGLAIVRRIVHRHGGRVWAEASPDKGATFSFTLEEGVNV